MENKIKEKSVAICPNLRLSVCHPSIRTVHKMNFLTILSLLLTNKPYLCKIYQSESNYVIIETKLVDNEQNH